MMIRHVLLLMSLFRTLSSFSGNARLYLLLKAREDVFKTGQENPDQDHRFDNDRYIASEKIPEKKKT